MAEASGLISLKQKNFEDSGSQHPTVIKSGKGIVKGQCSER